MSCSDLLDRIEAFAAGDLPVDEGSRAHLETCPRCAAALAAAQRLETALLEMETPAAPPAFTATVLQRVRRERWRAEQNVDRLFNVAMVAAVVLVVGSIAAMLNLSAIPPLAEALWAVLREAAREGVRQAAPNLPTYVGAACLLATALVMWWWAERKLQY